MSVPISTRLWSWSDTHFGHHNITVYCQRPATHDVIMLDNWIKRVPEDGAILHLGDAALGRKGNRKRWVKVMSRMPGKKYLVLGNHDVDGDGNPVEDYEAAGFEIVDPFIWEGLPGSALFRYGKIAFTHFPISDTNPGPDGEWDINIHGHIHLNPIYDRDGTPYEGKRYINLSVENTELAPVQLGNVLGSSRYDTRFYTA